MRIFSAGESEILALLYSGIFEQPLWSGFLNHLRSLTGASYTALNFRTVDKGDLLELHSGAGVPEYLQRISHERYGRDPLPHHAMREGRIYSTAELVDLDDPMQRSFYEAILATSGMRCFRSVRVSEPSGGEAWLSIANDIDFSAAHAVLLDRLVPHLRISLRTFAELERERFRSSVTSEVFGRLNFGWLILDGQCRILDSSGTMARLFERTSELGRGRHNRLMFASSSVEKAMTDLVKQFAETGSGQPRAINLSRDPLLDIVFAPVKTRSLTSGATPAAIVFVSGDRQSISDRCDQLVDLFGLLPSEAKLTWVLAQGVSISQAAEAVGITVETARTYSKKIYAKTGASGQAELVRIIMTSILALA